MNIVTYIVQSYLIMIADKMDMKRSWSALMPTETVGLKRWRAVTEHQNPRAAASLFSFSGCITFMLHPAVTLLPKILSYLTYFPFLLDELVRVGAATEAFA